MKKLNLKLGGIKEMLTREQMKKVVGGDGYGGGDSGGGKRYSCCPGAMAVNVQCSECVTVPAGYTATCSLGTLTPC